VEQGNYVASSRNAYVNAGDGLRSAICCEQVNHAPNDDYHKKDKRY
jgi:hypothetical protein